MNKSTILLSILFYFIVSYSLSYSIKDVHQIQIDCYSSDDDDDDDDNSYFFSLSLSRSGKVCGCIGKRTKKKIHIFFLSWWQRWDVEYKMKTKNFILFFIFVWSSENFFSSHSFFLELFYSVIFFFLLDDNRVKQTTFDIFVFLCMCVCLYIESEYYSYFFQFVWTNNCNNNNNRSSTTIIIIMAKQNNTVSVYSKKKKWLNIMKIDF